MKKLIAVLMMFCTSAFATDLTPTMTGFTEFGTAHVPVVSNTNNDTAKVQVDGSILFTAITGAGPAFGSSGYGVPIAGTAYRNTGEGTLVDPAMVTRSHSYIFEDEATNWLGILTTKGLCIGCSNGDAPYNSGIGGRLSIKAQSGENALNLQSNGDTYFSYDSPAATNDKCTIYRTGGIAVAFMGVCPKELGSTYQNKLVAGKIVAGVWTVMTTLASW